MKLVMTMMVRDEADIVGAMIEHHLAQGIDFFIVTDNGSVDGTTEILQEFAEKGILELRHDPVHRKQQGETVTVMARDAYTVHGADWVLNADADEFWIPVNDGLSLRDAFAAIDPAIQSFPVDVIDMIGAPALAGTGLQRLTYRDYRSLDALHSVGLISHSTYDSPHIGSADVTVSQGNHFVSLDSRGTPPEGFEIEVLHFQWRSWEQFSRKVQNAGSAYESQTGLVPSPNHHGMREYGRLKAGTLMASYVVRHPSVAELEAGLETGEYRSEGRIAAASASTVPDVLFYTTEETRAPIELLLGSMAEVVKQAAAEKIAEAEAARGREAELNALTDVANNRIADLEAALEVELTNVRRWTGELEVERVEHQATRAAREALKTELAELRDRRSVKFVNSLAEKAAKVTRKR